MRGSWGEIRAAAQRPFLRNLLTVGSGSAVAQAIAFAFTPLVTRLYGPESIGLFNVFSAIVGIAATVAGLGYPLAIVLPKGDGEALSLARLSVRIALGFCSLMFLALFFWGKEVFELLNASLIAGYWSLVPLAVLLTTIGTVVNQCLIRDMAYSLAAKVAIGSAVITNVAKVGLGYLSPTAFVLVLIGTLTQAVTWILSLWGRRHDRAPLLTGNEEGVKGRSREIAVARRYKDFPLFRAPQVLLNSASQNLPVLLIANFFGPASAGQFGLAWSILFAPVLLVGNAMTAAFYPRIARAVSEGSPSPQAMLVKATLAMLASGAVPYGLIVILGPWAVPWIFGEEWDIAGRFAQILAPWMFLQYANRPVVAALPALNLQGGLLLYEGLSTASKLMALWVGFSLFHSSWWAVGLFSLSGVIAYAWLIAWTILRSRSIEPRS